MRPDSATLPESMPLHEAADVLEQARHHGFAGGQHSRRLGGHFFGAGFRSKHSTVKKGQKKLVGGDVCTHTRLLVALSR